MIDSNTDIEPTPLQESLILLTEFNDIPAKDLVNPLTHSINTINNSIDNSMLNLYTMPFQIPRFTILRSNVINTFLTINSYVDVPFLIESGKFKDVVYKYTKIEVNKNKFKFEILIDDLFESKIKLEIIEFKYIVENILRNILTKDLLLNRL